MTDLLSGRPESLPVVAPALAAVLLFALGSRWRAPLVVSAALLISLSAGFVLFRLVSAGPYDHNIGGWGAPLGIAWRVDGFAGIIH